MLFSPLFLVVSPLAAVPEALQPADAASGVASLVPHRTFAAGPVVVTVPEAQQLHSCSFLNESSSPSDSCWLEKPTSDDAKAFVRPGATILEVGARYGSVSCQLAALTENSGRVVSVEPDSKVWHTLESNLHRHNCSVNVLHGVLATEPLHIKRNAYATHTNEIAGGSSGSSERGVDTVVPAMSFDELTSKSGLKFDTLVIDCEGCVVKLLENFPQMLDHAHTLIIEADYANGDWWCRTTGICIDYEKDIFPKFTAKGLVQAKKRGQDYVFQKPL